MIGLLKNIYNDIISDKIITIAVYSERSYVQDDFSGFYCELDGFRSKEYSEIYNKLHMKLKMLCEDKNINIYFNHIVFEVVYNDKKLYLGLNDNSLSLSYQMATRGGKRYEM